MTKYLVYLICAITLIGYDYSIYKEYKSQYLVVTYRKNEKDTMLDISYMTTY